MDDLLQIAKITQKTTSIEIVGESRSGVIYLREGRVLDAEVTGVTITGDGVSRVIESILLLTTISEGTFEFGNRPVPTAGRPIEVKVILDAIEKDLAREKRLADLGLTGEDEISIRRRVEGPITFQPAVWHLVAELLDGLSLDRMERRMGRRKAVATVLALENAGVLAHNGTRHGPPAADAPAGADEPVVLDAEVVAVEAAPAEATSDPVADVPDEAVPGPTDIPPSGQEQTDASPAPDSEEPIVEIFDNAPGEPVVEVFDEPGPRRQMHEVVAPSDTTLVSDVLSDLRSRFRSNPEQ